MAKRIVVPTRTNKELEEKSAMFKKRSNEHDHSADACMAFFLPSEFIALEE
jgi:hypothetical protein